MNPLAHAPMAPIRDMIAELSHRIQADIEYFDGVMPDDRCRVVRVSRGRAGMGRDFNRRVRSAPHENPGGQRRPDVTVMIDNVYQ